MDFFRIRKKRTNRQTIVYPDFIIKKSDYLLVRGGVFYAIWLEDRKIWSEDIYDVCNLIDRELKKYSENLDTEDKITINYLSSFSNGSWNNFINYVSKLTDNYQTLNSKIIFSNTKIQKKDYVSKKLPYPIEKGETPHFDKLFGTLYNDENLEKIMWSIGSIISGESKNIQKFFVLFGSPGTGKSTVLNLIQKMFPIYYTVFEAKNLSRNISGFSTEIFRNNPLIGINHEGDLSYIQDNSLLNSIASHDALIINAKYERQFTLKLNTTMYIATNKPVAISDAKSGLIRRLIDIKPTGDKVSPKRYDVLISKINFEFGHIAYKCLETFKKLGKNYYDHYIPHDMILRTNHIFNFIIDHEEEFSKYDYITLKDLWFLYKTYCENIGVLKPKTRIAFRDEAKNYWEEFHTTKRIDNIQHRSVFQGFKNNLLKENFIEDLEIESWLDLKNQPSRLDLEITNQKAQLTNNEGLPIQKWEKVKTKISDIDTRKLHYFIPPKNHIVIDFDIKDKKGEKSLELNLKKAKNFPETYCEVSKSGKGLHLHYYYEGDVESLKSVFSDENTDVEILKPKGNSSIRRKLSLCNDLGIKTISSGLPLKNKKKMISDIKLTTEKTLRRGIIKALNKEVHQDTTSNVHFIYKLLKEAEEKNVNYDVSDLRSSCIYFASMSTNNASKNIKLLQKLKFKSEEEEEIFERSDKEKRLVFFDIEVFSNLILICWKFQGENQPVQKIFNPTPEDVRDLIRLKLVGFNNRKYDNHILYAILLGMSIEEVFDISYRIISKDKDAYFAQAYNLSYVDVYCYSSKKQTLKKWEVELGFPHKELEHDWDKPIPKEKWEQVAEYCSNDVVATELLHNHLSADFNARLIISDISGLPPNYSTLSHTSKIIFGKEKNPQKSFNHIDLSLDFPGYEFKNGRSFYKGEIVGEGGYVFSKPGIYKNVTYLDISSMHPTSLIEMDLFGEYTSRYKQLVEARLAIKNGELEKASSMFEGKLKKHIKQNSDIKGLSYALKIIINIVYGLTASRFPNPFRDNRNVDNVVAKRGSLFMIDLKETLLQKNIECIHIKTDSIKIVDCKKEDLEFIKNFSKKYGYEFGIEGVYEKLILINDVDLVGKWNEGEWDSVGARFSHPYVFKTMFSKEEIELNDLSEIKAVKDGSIYINTKSEDSEYDIFIGKVGKFIPMRKKGGNLIKISKDKRYAVSGTKDWEWLTYEQVKKLQLEKYIDYSYFTKLYNDAMNKILSFCDDSLIQANDFIEAGILDNTKWSL